MEQEKNIDVEQEPLTRLVETIEVKKSTLKKIKNAFKIKPLAKFASITIFLIIIMSLAAYTRLPTMDSPTVLDYDPWWHYRHAKAILENDFKVPEWDLQSFYPPGRPTEKAQGWEYTIVIFYKIASFFSHISFTEAAKLSPVIMVALTAIPAFFLGRLLSNNWGGLATALFATLSTTFMTVSMAGYSDTDAVVVFYLLLCVYTMLLALKKRSLLYYALAILTNIVFIYHWTGWIVLLLFAAFSPLLVLFRIVEEIVHQKRLKIDVMPMLIELKSVFLPLVIVFVGVNLISYFFGLTSMLRTLSVAMEFSGLGGEPLLVNISVAELQAINVFKISGFLQLIDRVGLAPVIFATFGLPLIVVYKIYKKEKIDFVEIFLFVWFLITFYMITRGVRFALLFSAATAVSSGYVIGQFGTHKKIALFILTISLMFSMLVFPAAERGYIMAVTFIVSVVALLFSFKKITQNILTDSLTFGVTMLFILLFVSNALQLSYQMTGMEISENWYEMLDWLKENADEDTLIMTWWDPGHIIAGYTGLKVQADGAHCGSGQCKPYNHNIRIQDTGRMFTTNDEETAVTLIEKYTSLTPEHCQESRDAFGDRVPENACNPISEVYIIASADLIQKYYWMSFFGDCLKQFGLGSSACYESINWFKENAQGRNYFQMGLTGYDDRQGIIEYAGGQLLLAWKDNQWVPLLNIPEQGIRNVVVRELVYYENGVKKRIDYGNVSSTINGMVWVDPSYQLALFMDPEIKDSIFTRMFFFDGEGLNHFDLVFQNSEIRLYKVKF